MKKNTRRLYALATSILFIIALNSSIKKESYLLEDHSYNPALEESKQLNKKRGN